MFCVCICVCVSVSRRLPTFPVGELQQSELHSKKVSFFNIQPHFDVSLLPCLLSIK